MMNTRHGAPEITGLNPFFPELTTSEIKDFMIALRGGLSPESFRKLHVCTFNQECTVSGDKDD